MNVIRATSSTGRRAAVAGLIVLCSLGAIGAALADTPGAPDAIATNAAGTGAAVSSGAAGPATAKSPIPVCGPLGIAVNTQDELFVANHFSASTGCPSSIGEGQVLVFDKTGVQLTNRTIAEPLNPQAMTFDKSGNIYVTIYTVRQVRVYDPTGKLIPNRTLSTDKSYNPAGVEIDSNGDVWVVNRTNNNITLGELEIFHAGGGVDKITTGLVYPLSIAFQAKSEKAWVGNAEYPSGESFTLFSANGRFLDTIPTPNFLPTYLAFAKNGRLYATGGANSQVGIFDSAGKQIGGITVGLDQPYGIAFDSAGDIYVANFGNNTITKYSPAGFLLCTITKSGCSR
jgi:WD40 repeat protein